MITICVAFLSPAFSDTPDAIMRENVSRMEHISKDSRIGGTQTTTALLQNCEYIILTISWLKDKIDTKSRKIPYN